MAASKSPVGFQPRPPRLKVEVTQKDIDDAKPKSSNHCMIATAIGRGVPGASHIDVDTASIRFSVGEHRYYYAPTPPKAANMLVDWDEGVKIEPFSFVLREGYVKPIVRAPGRGGRPKKGTAPARTTPLTSSHPHRRTYGARSITAAKIAAAKTRAVRHGV
jgi:hypothetical protein